MKARVLSETGSTRKLIKNQVVWPGTRSLLPAHYAECCLIRIYKTTSSDSQTQLQAVSHRVQFAERTAQRLTSTFPRAVNHGLRTDFTIDRQFNISRQADMTFQGGPNYLPTHVISNYFTVFLILLCNFLQMSTLP